MLNSILPIFMVTAMYHGVDANTSYVHCGGWESPIPHHSLWHNVSQ